MNSQNNSNNLNQNQMAFENYEDPDVIFVDFDELFDSKSLQKYPNYGNHQEATLEQYSYNNQPQIYAQPPMNYLPYPPIEQTNSFYPQYSISNDHPGYYQPPIPLEPIENQPEESTNNLFPTIKSEETDSNDANDPNKQINSSSKPAMTREQFYKIRPRMPRISKNDPRRFYSAAFIAAFNACDFNKIWEFGQQFCTKDILYIHRFVGSESYFNFPKYIEKQGIEKMSEYWFSRCLLVPDYIVELKETKLYVRSDGISTVLSSFTIENTRLYDGEVSDAFICGHANPANVSDTSSLQYLSTSQATSGTSLAEKHRTNPHLISNRVFERMKQILVSHRSNTSDQIKDKLLSNKRKYQDISPPNNYNNPTYSNTTNNNNNNDDSSNEFKEEYEDKIHLFYEKDFNLEMTSYHNHNPHNNITNNTSNTSNNNNNNNSQVCNPAPENIPKKKVPQGRNTTLISTVTMHLNKDNKIRQMEVTYDLLDDNESNN